MYRIRFTTDMVQPLRRKLGMTQESFAYVVGCGNRVIYNYERGKVRTMQRSIRNSMIRLMLDNNISPEELLKEEL